ncbi:MAG: adenylate/guanylate cyclase domain-containing protein [Gammaproteobacteria bacterium]|nr:adenylate/guanylate cyclase domain-containing protein [Gammaproteobacteria bacterium]MBV9698368.1 adenylate/guanylate cyclase domain-containing protein [Gammaproteobacteria bacterium]
MSIEEPLKAHIEALLRASALRRKSAAAELEAEIRRREEVLRQTFRRYVSPRVADKILEDAQLRDALLATTAHARAHAVVLFADLRGFTSISEQLDARHVVPLLNEYFSLLTDITFRHEGTVFHMAGDCLMLGFGVPLEQPDSAGRAVQAAREMLSSFGALASSWQERYQVEAGLGIGINEGDVVAGNIGSSAYMNYTIIGDAVNIAARLCQRARAGEMLFSSTLKRSLDAQGIDVGATPLPPLQLRGRSQPIDIYCVPLQARMQLTPGPLPA